MALTIATTWTAGSVIATGAWAAIATGLKRTQDQS
jgi:hypothetical protein